MLYRYTYISTSDPLAPHEWVFSFYPDLSPTKYRSQILETTLVPEIKSHARKG